MKSFIQLWNGKEKTRFELLDDESRRAIAAGLYELEQLITEIHENNPMLGTIEASGYRMKAKRIK